MTRGYRKLHNEKRHNMYSSPNIIRMMKSSRRLIEKNEMSEVYSTHEVDENCIQDASFKA
jgi:hypothetical protein